MTAFEELKKVFTKGASISSAGYLNKIYTDHWARYYFQDRNFIFWATHILRSNKLLDFVPSSRPKRGKAFLNSQGKAFFSLEGNDQLPSLVKYTVFEAVARIINKLLEEIRLAKEEIPLDKIEELSGQFISMFRDAIFSAEWIDADKFLLKGWDLAQTLFPDKLLESREVSQLMSDNYNYLKTTIKIP
jgi:hypothetical protein